MALAISGSYRDRQGTCRDRCAQRLSAFSPGKLPATTIGRPDSEPRLMQTKDPTTARTHGLADPERGVSHAERRVRPRPRMNIAAQIPAMQVRRIIVLAERFQELCRLRTDPLRLIDLLRSLIICSREAFLGGLQGPRGVRRTGRASADQVRCLEDLELLLQGLMRGAPGASRGLGHAMDALLIQCVIFEAEGMMAAAESDPGQG